MSMTARQVGSRDFEEFDLILGMDLRNVQDLCAWPGAKPEKVRLTRSFDADATTQEVPDPYYGDTRDFEAVADMLETACRGVLASLSHP